MRWSGPNDSWILPIATIKPSRALALASNMADEAVSVLTVTEDKLNIPNAMSTSSDIIRIVEISANPLGGLICLEIFTVCLII